MLDNYTARQFLATFNAAEVPLAWRDTETTEGNFSWTTSDKQVEWCRAHGLKVFAGPLLTLDPHALPDWYYLFEDDFESVLDFVSAFVRAAVERYRGKVDYWICAGRANTAGVPSLSEAERLQLVARTVDLVRSLDPDTPALVSFDQPWAEYLRQQESDFPPLHFADALMRAGLGLTGVMMEMNVGYWPGGTLPRHPLEFNRLLDAWSLLGLPLWLSLCVPSAYHEDPLARTRRRCRRAVGPPPPNRRGSPASCRWRWPSRWCRGWCGTSSATANPTISLTAGYSTIAVRPNPRCARSPRSGRRI